MPDFIFDGPNRIILEPAGVGDTSFEVDRDIYSAWKRWVQSGSGIGFAAAFEIEGGTPIGATGLFTGTTFILTNGWKIQPANHDHQVLLIGNLYSDDGIVSVPSVSARTNVFVNSSVAAQGVATGDVTVVNPDGGTGGLTTPQEQALYEARDHARAANAQTQRSV